LEERGASFQKRKAPGFTAFVEGGSIMNAHVPILVIVAAVLLLLAVGGCTSSADRELAALDQTRAEREQELNKLRQVVQSIPVEVKRGDELKRELLALQEEKRLLEERLGGVK